MVEDDKKSKAKMEAKRSTVSLRDIFEQLNQIFGLLLLGLLNMKRCETWDPIYIFFTRFDMNAR